MLPSVVTLAAKKITSLYACYPFSSESETQVTPLVTVTSRYGAAGYICGMKGCALWENEAAGSALGHLEPHRTRSTAPAGSVPPGASQCVSKKFLQVPSQSSFPQRNLQGQGKQF